MIGSLLKAIAYSKAPKTTFALLHPEPAFQLKKMPYDLRNAYAPRLTAVATLLIALPIGILLGRRLERGRLRRVRRRVRTRLQPASLGRPPDAASAASSMPAARRPATRPDAGIVERAARERGEP